jgi:hypothetical protein
MSPWQQAAIASALLALIVAPVTLSLSSGEVWSELTPGNCTEYCENHHRCGAPAMRPAIQQPMNTWSNLAYVFFGFVALLPRRADVLARLFGVSMLLLGTGSFLFHASITREMQWLDVVGMYAVQIALIAVGVGRLWPVSPMALLVGALATDVLFAAFKWQINTWLAIPALGAVTAVLIVLAVRRDGRPYRGPMVALPLLGAGILLQRLEVHRVICFPESFFQPHAAWHLLTAIALYLAYHFFETMPPGNGRGRHEQTDWYREAA